MPGSSLPRLSQSDPEAVSWLAGSSVRPPSREALPRNGLNACGPAPTPEIASRKGVASRLPPLATIVVLLLAEQRRLSGKLLKLELTQALSPVSAWPLRLPPLLPLAPLLLPAPEPTSGVPEEASPSGLLEASNVVALLETDTAGRLNGVPKDGNAASASSGGPVIPKMCA